MRAFVLLLALAATGCLEADLFEPVPQAAPAEPATVSMSLLTSHCSFSFASHYALSVETKFDVTLQAFYTYQVTYTLPDDPAYSLVVTHSCGGWDALPANDGTSVGCLRDADSSPEQVLATHAASADAAISNGMQIRIAARITDDSDAVVMTDERTIDCAPSE